MMSECPNPGSESGSSLRIRHSVGSPYRIMNVTPGTESW